MVLRAHGIDVSVWQDANSTPQQINFDKAVLNGADFVFIKASQLILDQDFVYNWHAAKQSGLLRGAYHYLDWRKSELEQAKLFVDIISADPGELPPVCDFEERRNAPPADIARGKLWNFLSYVEKNTGKIPMIYTGFYFWYEFGGLAPEWARYPLWLAWWAKESFVKAPKPWQTWTFWQYSDKGDGAAFGCESKQVDVNWFNGTYEKLKTFAGVSNPIPARICPTCGQEWKE